MNRYDYVTQHAEAIPYPFDSASNESVESERISLDGYPLVDWILGQESYHDETLSDEEQRALKRHLDRGGALFISGSEIGWDLDNLGGSDDKEFFEDYLRANFVSDDAQTYEVKPVSGSIFDGLGSFRFDTPGMYLAEYPDRLSVSSGSVEALKYRGGDGGTAAIQYADGCERVVTFGFPFETIGPEKRSGVMQRILDFLDECLHAPSEATIETPEDGSAHRGAPSFSGSAQDFGNGLQRVDVQVMRQSDDHFWTGSTWQTSPAWIAAQGLSSWTYYLPALADGSYVLGARACGSDSTCTPTPNQVTFTVDTVVPPPTSLISPIGGVTLKAVAVELRWQPISQDGGSEIGYEVRVDERVYRTAEPTYVAWVAGSGSHTWGVRVVDKAGNSSALVQDRFSLTQVHFWLPFLPREFDR
jgi:hypothetical protein